MSFSNEMKMGVGALKYKCLKKRTPLLVSLSVTGRCNLKCPYCYISVCSREPTEPSLEELKRYIDEFCNLGTQIFLLQGGEPMIRKDIVDLVRYIKTKNRIVYISTNGTINKPIPDLKGLIDHIEFSIDGPPEINDKTRGTGVFKKTIESAKIAKENGIGFHFHSVLNIYNIEEDNLKYMANLAKEYDTYLTSCFASSSGYENNQEFIHQVPDEKQKEIYQLLKEMKKEGYPIGSSNFALDHALNWPIKYNEIGFRENLPHNHKGRCTHGRLTAWFDHEGWIYPCTLAFGRDEFRENVNELGLTEAWNRLSKLKCVDCGIASDITSIFNFNIESMKEILLNKKY